MTENDLQNKKTRFSLSLNDFTPVDIDRAWKRVSAGLKNGGRSRRGRILRRVMIPAVSAVAAVFILLMLNTEQPQDGYSTLPVISRPIDNSVVYISDGTESVVTELHTVVTEQGDVIRKDDNSRLDLNLAAMNTIRVPRGMIHHITLPDGSEVALNAATTLSFPARFSGESREVTLEGEAYFKVKKSDKPFIVVYGGTSVEVLGTEFNINCYPGSPVIRTTLVAGSIRVSNAHNSLVMTPSQLYTYNTATHNSTIETVDTSPVVSWVEGKFEFRNLPLEEVATQITRWYNIEFIFADEQIKQIPFTGATYRDGNANNLLNIIERISNVKFSYSADGTIVIDRK